MYRIKVRQAPYPKPGAKGAPRWVSVGDQEVPRIFSEHATPSEDDDRPAYRLDFEVINGVPECRAVHIESTAWGREVRRTDLDFPLEHELEWAAQVAAALRSGEFEMVGPGSSFVRAIRQARRGSLRRGPSDDQLREAVDVYRSADHAPTEAVADRFGIAHRTASLWIKRAREKDMF